MNDKTQEFLTEEINRNYPQAKKFFLGMLDMQTPDCIERFHKSIFEKAFKQALEYYIDSTILSVRTKKGMLFVRYSRRQKKFIETFNGVEIDDLIFTIDFEEPRNLEYLNDE